MEVEVGLGHVSDTSEVSTGAVGVTNMKYTKIAVLNNSLRNTNIWSWTF